MKTALQYLYLMFPALLQKVLRKIPVRNHNVYGIQAADVEAAFEAKLTGIHQYNDLVRLPYCRLLQNRLIPYAAAKACRRMIPRNSQECLVKIHALQLLDGGKPEYALTVACLLYTSPSPRD